MAAWEAEGMKMVLKWIDYRSLRFRLKGLRVRCGPFFFERQRKPADLFPVWIETIHAGVSVAFVIVKGRARFSEQGDDLIQADPFPPIGEQVLSRGFLFERDDPAFGPFGHRFGAKIMNRARLLPAHQFIQHFPEVTGYRSITVFSHGQSS